MSPRDITLLTVREVAALLHPDVRGSGTASIGWWYRKRKALEARGFPLPVEGCGNHWDPRAVRAWLDAQMDPRLKAILELAAPSSESAGADDWQAKLDARAQALGKAA